MSLTIGELLSLDGLESLHVRAGRRALTNPVRWYYVAENNDIGSWLMGGELVFVTGVNQLWDEGTLLSLIHEAKANNAAGVVILTKGPSIPHIPIDVVTLADQLELPLIEQPYNIKIVMVTERIGSAMVKWAKALKSQQEIIYQLFCGDSSEADINRIRAKYQNLDIDQSVYVVALQLSGAHSVFKSYPIDIAENILQKNRTIFLQKLNIILNECHIDFPLIEIDDIFVTLIPVFPSCLYDFKSLVEELISELSISQDYPFDIFCGISTPTTDIQNHRLALKKARRALEMAVNHTTLGHICEYSKLGFIKLICEIENQEILIEFMNENLGPLINHGKKKPCVLLETMEIYYRENLSVVQTAHHLGIHRNTLHQRIRKIESITGQSIGNPQFHLNASIALLIWRMQENKLGY